MKSEEGYVHSFNVHSQVRRSRVEVGGELIAVHDRTGRATYCGRLLDASDWSLFPCLAQMPFT